MVARPILALVVVFAALSLGGPLRAETAGELANSCAKLSAPAGAPDLVISEESPEAQQCWGAFLAVQELAGLTDSRGRILHFCSPMDGRRLDFVRAFVEFVAAHGELRGEPFGVVAIMALQAEWPCR